MRTKQQHWNKQENRRHFERSDPEGFTWFIQTVSHIHGTAKTSYLFLELEEAFSSFEENKRALNDKIELWIN